MFCKEKTKQPPAKRRGFNFEKKRDKNRPIGLKVRMVCMSFLFVRFLSLVFGIVFIYVLYKKTASMRLADKT